LYSYGYSLKKQICFSIVVRQLRHMSTIKYALLNVPVATRLIQEEVEALQKSLWQPHINLSHYAGEWNVLSLRSPGGTENIMADAINNEEYTDTPLMQQCPSILALVNGLQCEKLSVRLLSLYPGAIIKEHTDKELCFEKGETRLHFPIFTNQEVEFYLDNDRLQMREGECWYINANLPHRVANKGRNNRIHLVVDCKVNNWLQDVFQNYCIKKEVISDAEETYRNSSNIKRTIGELRRQSNQVAHDLADKLEKELYEAERHYHPGNNQPAAITQSNGTQFMNDEITDKIITFIRSLGIAVHEQLDEDDSFLPGMVVKNGSLMIDRHNLRYPGDLLHEAGHIAVTPSNKRAELTTEMIGKSIDRAAEEMMAIAWSYAACIYLAIDPEIVFHADGYKGGGERIVENFRDGKFFGTPMLQWCGMTIEPKNGDGGKKVFPVMIKWMRD
jgi:hypothetical protein